MTVGLRTAINAGRPRVIRKLPGVHFPEARECIIRMREDRINRYATLADGEDETLPHA